MKLVEDEWGWYMALAGLTTTMRMHGWRLGSRRAAVVVRHVIIIRLCCIFKVRFYCGTLPQQQHN